MVNVAVIGLGKLGVPLAAVMASQGHNVVGVDVNPEVVRIVNAGQPPFDEPGLGDRMANCDGRLRATCDYADAIPATDISFVIVPTPSGPDGAFSNQYVLEAVRQIGSALRQSSHYHVINITSTVMPGSTGGEILAALEEASGRRVGHDVGLTYNPEFIALGSVVRDLLRPDMVLIGQQEGEGGDRAAAVLASVYATTVENAPPVQRMNWISAELTKIAVNTFVTTKISYANMLAEMCERLPGADVDTVTAALGKDSRIGPKYLRGALGYGGPCFPRDNVALAALARSLGTRADVAEATDTVNRRQVDRIVDLVRRFSPGHARVAILGLSYKPDTPVVEESQGVLIAQALAAAGHDVLIADPVALDNAAAALGNAVRPFANAEAAVAAASIVIIATPDPTFRCLSPGCFAASPNKIVIDCWRLLGPDITAVAEVVHIGRGPIIAV